MASALPQKIGRYEIQGELGRGMMGVVYEAHDPALSRAVALKTINPSFASSAEDREAFERRFETEARIAGRLSHPNVVVVHDVGRDEETGILYIALERLQGETLSELVQRGVRLPWEEVLIIGLQVADALQHLHSEGVTHRDVKPANVMRLPAVSGQLYRPVKLMDFGIAKLDTAQLTAAGQFFGTPLYMAPEQAANETVDARADLFSLGSVLYVLLTGRHAFAANNVVAILQRVVNEDPAPPTSLEKTLPPSIDDVMARCMAKDPAERYQDAQDVADDLNDVLAGRPPRHIETWTKPPVRTGPPVSGTLAPIPEATITADPGEPVEGTQTVPPPLGAQRKGRLGLYTDIGVVLAVAALATWVLLRPGRSSDAAPPVLPGEATTVAASVTDPARPDPTAAPTNGVEAPVATPTPATRAARVAPAEIVVDFQYPFRSGTLQIYMNDKRILRRSVAGRVDKNLLLVKTHEGVLTEHLELPAGRHVFDVEVTWDDNLRQERIRGRFLAGETYRLQIRVGRLRKNLSLKWTR